MNIFLSQENRYMGSPYRIQDSWSTIQISFELDDISISGEETLEEKITKESEEEKCKEDSSILSEYPQFLK